MQEQQKLKPKEYNKHITAIHFLLLTLVAIFSVALLTVIIQGNRSKNNSILNTLRDNLLEQKKSHIKLIVEQISHQIEYEINRSKYLLRSNAHQQVKETFILIQSIYENNYNLSPQKIKKLIANAIRPICYDGRGYLFLIDKKSKKVVMNGLMPHLEKFTKKQKTLTNSICNKMVTLAEKNRSGSHISWKFKNDSNEELATTGFVKSFDALDLVVGSGQIVNEATKEIQKNILTWIANNYSESDGYAFIVDKTGHTLLYNNDNAVSENIVEKYEDGTPLSWESVQLMKNGRGYLTNNTSKEDNRIVYVRSIDEWKWIVGGREYLTEIAPALEHQSKRFRIQNRNELYGILLVCGLFILSIGVYVYRISEYVNMPFLQRIEESKSQLHAPLYIGGEEFKLTYSIGAVICPDSSPAELISKSQTILNRVKLRRQNELLFYNQEVKTQLEREIQIERVLDDAIDDSEFTIVYQPQITAQNEQINSIEALCRWRNKGLGFVSPLEFIPIAENSDVIFRLGEYIFEQACIDVMKIPKQNNKDVGISINISPRQLLYPNFANRIIDIVERIGITAQRITLEITENILIDDVNLVLPIFTVLRDYGFAISLDDFGTGFSSLRYLNTLPISEIKIDKTFIDQMFISKQSENLIRAMIAIGISAHLTVVAEGVETRQQLEWLQQQNCTLIQGYYYSRPLLIDTLLRNYSFDTQA